MTACPALKLFLTGCSRFCAVLLLAGCSAVPVLLPEPQPSDYAVLPFLQWLGTADRATVGDMRHLLEERSRASLTLVERIQLSMILGMEPGIENQEAAAVLIDSTAGMPADDPRASDYAIFASTWREKLALAMKPPEVREVIISNDQVLKNLEDRNRFLEGENSLLQQQRALLEKRNKFLEAQVEELTNIERQIMQREQSQTTP